MGTALHQAYESSIIKFSIIVPVYNVEKFLRECLDSITLQTLKEFEVICINDGSTDNSLEILNEYAKEDKRFIVLNQENQGQGIARNIGIDIAKGEYLLFVDPDDWLELNTLEILYNNFKKYNVDVIQFDYKNFKECEKKYKLKSFAKRIKKYYKVKLKNKQIYTYKDFKINLLQEMSLCVWDKAYSTKYIKINKIKNAPSKQGEDHVFSIAANLLTNNILYLQQTLYNYRTRMGSAVNKGSDDNFCIFDNVNILEKFLIANGLYTKYEKSFRDYTLTVFAWHYTCIPKESIESYLNKCAEILSEDEYGKFLNKIKGNRSFIEQIFSLKNQKVNGERFKVVTVLGIPFKIKHKKKAGIE